MKPRDRQRLFFARQNQEPRLIFQQECAESTRGIDIFLPEGRHRATFGSPAPAGSLVKVFQSGNRSFVVNVIELPSPGMMARLKPQGDDDDS